MELHPQIPLHFIGRVEHIDRDWQLLFAAVNRRNRRRGLARVRDVAPLEQVRRTGSAARGAHNDSEKRALWQSVMRPDVIALAHEAFAQDVVSLGYGWLTGSYESDEHDLLAPADDLVYCT